MLPWVVRTFAIGALAFCGLARASLIYDFHVGAAGGIDAFSFSFTVPSFLGENQSPSFFPFTITDGIHTWKMVKDLTGLNPEFESGCFMFATEYAFVLPPCNFAT